MASEARVFYARSIDNDAQNADELKLTAEIWKAMVDGSNRKRLWSEQLEGEWNSSLSDLELSHDGQHLVFIRFVDKRATTIWSSSLWVMDVNGTNLKEMVSQSPVTPGAADWVDENENAFLAKLRPMFPGWSPDDSLIAFIDWRTYSNGEPGTVYVLDAETGEWNAFGQGEVFAWSPDGSALAIHTERDFESVPTLRILNLDGETVSTVSLPPSLFLKSLDWSASAGLLVAKGANYQEQVSPILVIDPAAGIVQTVIDDAHNIIGFGPQWSPDGKMISYGHTIADSTDLFILDLDSGEIRPIISQVGSHGVWSPDSKFLLIKSQVDGNGLYCVRVSDGQYWKIPYSDGDSQEVGFSSYDWLFPP